MDAVQKAGCGHPGAPMGLADIAQVLWGDHLKHHPAAPDWVDRDRFILSNGHASMLLYAVLHLSGYGLEMEEIKNFRQLNAKTPGHPEYGCAPGVETTTGPLGQGLANAVGMAIAERVLGARFNRDGHEIVDHFTYVFVGDGCLMEGVSHEACSLAGTLGLGKLIAVWDDNGVSIDGPVAGWFTDDTPRRFEAYNWHVIHDVDGHDPAAIGAALRQARAEAARPSLLCCKTVIGYGSPNKAGTAACHGAALGEDEVALARQKLDWPHPPFVVPDAIRAAWDGREKGAAAMAEWSNKFARYTEVFPQEAAEFKRRMQGRLPDDWPDAVADFTRQCADKAEGKATRQSSLAAITAYAAALPELFGGSADLGGSNGTEWPGHKPMRAGMTTDKATPNYVNYGVREFAMTAIINGIALHGGFIPFGATFLVFSDYARNALRMAALMKVRAVFVFTHDSIGLGEDGPTHQAIEQTPTLRMIPNMAVWRPCDAAETAAAWAAAIEREDGPTCLVLSRQGIPHQPRTKAQIADIRRGGYVLSDCEGEPQAIIIATGSEVAPAMAAAAQSDKRTRVVSMPSTTVFDAQDDEYKRQVLPPSVTARVAVEAAASAGWYKYVGPHGKIIGIDTFGASAPASRLFEHFGFTAANVVAAIEAVCAADGEG